MPASSPSAGITTRAGQRNNSIVLCRRWEILRIFMSISRARETCSQPVGADHAGQWEFQVGPSVGTSAGDQVWAARYILERITKIAGVVVTFDLKPIPGDWNGDGAHTNYSKESARKDVVVIMASIEKLKLRHKEHIAA